MPHGVSGLLIAAILAAAMSNLSAALNSLSSTVIVDFYARIRPQSSEQRRMQLSRLAMVVWGLILFVLAPVARHGGRVIEVGLSIASVAYGALLGVFPVNIPRQSPFNYPQLGQGRVDVYGRDSDSSEVLFLAAWWKPNCRHGRRSEASNRYRVL
jgi:hypothetical protein